MEYLVKGLASCDTDARAYAVTDSLIKMIRTSPSLLTHWDKFSTDLSSLMRELVALNHRVILHSEFSKGIASYLEILKGKYGLISWVLNKMNSHSDLFEGNSFSYHALFQKLYKTYQTKDKLYCESSLIAALSRVPQVSIDHANFFPTAQLLITDYQKISDSGPVIEALGSLFMSLKEKELPKEILPFLKLIPGVPLRAATLKEIGKHVDLYDKESFPYEALLRRLLNENSLVKNDPIITRLYAVRRVSLNHVEFFPTLQKLITPDMCTKETRIKMIAILENVHPENLKTFAQTAQAMMTADINAIGRLRVTNVLRELYAHIAPGNEFPKGIIDFINMIPKMESRQDIIEEIKKHTLLFHYEKFSYYTLFQRLSNPHTPINNRRYSSNCYYLLHKLSQIPEDIINDPNFFKTAASLMTKDMEDKDRSRVAEALGKVAHEKWDAFVKTSQSLMTASMNGENRAWVIGILADVSADKITRVYGQIQRLMEQTQGKIQLQRWEAVRQLIRQLRDCTSEDQAIAFTNDLIRRVNGVQGNVDDNTLLTHMNTAWARVRGATQNELQELVRQRQSTHNKEVHASVAESVKRLQARYQNKLTDGNIFQRVNEKFKAVFPQDTSTQFETAKAAAINLVGQDAIDKLLGISPHTRAAGGNEDTALNVAARALWQGQSDDVRHAIQELVSLHSHKDDLKEAEKFLNSLGMTFTDKDAKIGYEALLKLVYAAITDGEAYPKETDSKLDPLHERWLSLMRRIVRAQAEYASGNSACASGKFNAIIESLSQVHPDVRIINSFRALMQEISAEEDDVEFELRIQVARSYLGPDAANDPDYRSDIQDAREARKQRQDQDIEALDKLKADLAALKNMTDEEFEAAAAALAKALPKSLQEQKLLWNTLIVHERKARAEERSRGTKSAGSSDAIEDGPALSTPLPRLGLASSTPAGDYPIQ